MDEGKDKKEKEEKPEQRPGYIPPKHLKSFVAIDFEAANGEVTSACSVGIVIVKRLYRDTV